MYKRILVAVDGSDTSLLALAEAIGLAKVHQAQLRILHVVDMTPLFTGESYFGNAEALETGLVDSGKKILADALEKSERGGLHAETRLVEIEALNSRIADIVAQEAKAWPADVIIVGTHGRRGLSHLFLGSVAEGVIRAATVPVLLIRAK